MDHASGEIREAVFPVTKGVFHAEDPQPGAQFDPDARGQQIGAQIC